MCIRSDFLMYVSDEFCFRKTPLESKDEVIGFVGDSIRQPACWLSVKTSYNSQFHKFSGVGGRELLCETPNTEIVLRETVWMTARMTTEFDRAPFLIRLVKRFAGGG